jgi:multicomponent Na+:H+ antiporter subunit F
MKIYSGECWEARRMISFLMFAAVFVLVVVALGLMRLLLGPADADRIMSAQLLGSGGIAVLVLLAVATETPSLFDVAMLFALLAAFISVAFVMATSHRRSENLR